MVEKMKKALLWCLVCLVCLVPCSGAALAAEADAAQDAADGYVYDEAGLLTADEIADWQARSGLPLRRFFNTSGMKYRELGVKAMLDAGMAEGDARALLATDGMLVKRPIVVAGDTVLVGFKEAAWEAALL